MNARLLYLGTTVVLLALSACAQNQPASTPTGSRGVPDQPRGSLPAAPMSQDNPAAPAAPTVPAAAPSAPGENTYLRADTNKDGRVSAEEWDAARRSGGSAGSTMPR